MRNLITIDCTDSSQNSLLNSAEGNEVILFINPLASQQSGYTVTEQASGGVSRSSTDLTVEDGIVVFTIPFEWYSSAGSMNIRLESAEANSDYVAFTIAVNLTAEDDIVVKLINGVYVISKITSGSTSGGDYNDLDNKPSINSVTLIGNKTGTELSLINTDDLIAESEIDTIVFGGLG